MRNSLNWVVVLALKKSFYQGGIVHRPSLGSLLLLHPAVASFYHPPKLLSNKLSFYYTAAKMDDNIEERPNKIRKLNQSNNITDLNNVEVVPLDETINSKDATLLSNEDPMDGDAPSGNVEGEEVGEDTPKLSKSALKKLKRKQDWEAGKEYRRTKRKEKKQEKKARNAAEKTGDDGTKKVEAELVPPVKKKHPVQVPVTLILDCDFDDLMTDKEIVSLAQQLTRSYSDNKGATFKSNLIISSFNKNLKKRFEEGLGSTHLGWKGTKITDKHYVEAATEAQWLMESGQLGKLAGALLSPDATTEKITDNTEKKEVDKNASITENEEIVVDSGNKQDVETSNLAEPDASKEVSNTADKEDIQKPKEDLTPKIIYLTSDSPHSLDRLEQNTSYIIGGIVDKNRHKGLCYKRACDLGIETAKLPIGEYMMMQSRTVLTTNHVVEIMLRWLEDGDWGKAFLKVIPKRKEAKLRKSKKEECEDEDEDVNEDGDEIALESEKVSPVNDD